MATFVPGYEEERFETTVNRNFLCLICFNVLKDPVLCRRNQHCFCRACITKHLEDTRKCPACAEILTVETLLEPNRMVKDYLNELNIRCAYNDRGCQEILQVQCLDSHEAECSFAPVVCTNEGCGATLNKRDLVHHESELCEYRKLKCHSCGEMTKTLADMEKRITNVEKNIDSMEKHSTAMKERIEEVNNEVRRLKSALVEGFDQVKKALVKMEGKIDEIPGNVTNTASKSTEKLSYSAEISQDKDSRFFSFRSRRR